MTDLDAPELAEVARFYDQRLVGSAGSLGFRRTSVLGRLLPCLAALAREGMLIPGKSRFLDLGCGDGRVNVLFSYLTAASVGVEQDQWTLDEYGPLKGELEARMEERGLSRPPDNVRLFCGDSTSEPVHAAIREGAELVAAHGRAGSVYLVYGMDRIFPQYDGLELVEAMAPLERALAVYRK
jgi:hypothetical protein